jgi:hypothetical protein
VRVIVDYFVADHVIGLLALASLMWVLIRIHTRLTTLETRQDDLLGFVLSILSRLLTETEHGPGSRSATRAGFEGWRTGRRSS